MGLIAKTLPPRPPASKNTSTPPPTSSSSPKNASTPPPTSSSSLPAMPRGIAEPTTNPLRTPPPPDLPKRKPGRPRKDAAPATSPASPAPAPLEEPARELPQDPAARALALEGVRGSAVFVLTALDVLVSRLPPGRPLSVDEKRALQEPLELVLWKYDGELSPEAQLGAAVVMIAFGRFAEVKIAKQADEEKRAPKQPQPPNLTSAPPLAAA